MSATLSHVANGFGLFSTITIALFTYLAHSPGTLFFWHPIGMAFSFLVFMPQGVLALMSKHGIMNQFIETTERKFKVDLHFWLQSAATISYTIAFVCILANKIAKGSFHFTTWHALIGLICMIMCYLQLLVGTYLYYTWPKILLGKVMTHRPKDLTVKKWHRSLSVLAFLVGLFTCVLSLWSGFVSRNFPWEISLLLFVSFVAVGVSIGLIGLRIELPEWMS